MESISRVAEGSLSGHMAKWQSEPLARLYPAAVQVAATAKATHSQNVIDALLTTLLQFTRAADPTQPYAHAIVSFGSSTLAREATVALFDIAADYADLMRSGWATCLDCLLRLHKCRLVDPSIFTDAQVPLPPLHLVSVAADASVWPPVAASAQACVVVSGQACVMVYGPSFIHVQAVAMTCTWSIGGSVGLA